MDEMLKTVKHDDTDYIHDLLCNFPVGDLSKSAGIGVPVHGKPAHGEVPDLERFKNNCREIAKYSHSTIAKTKVATKIGRLLTLHGSRTRTTYKTNG